MYRWRKRPLNGECCSVAAGDCALAVSSRHPRLKNFRSIRRGIELVVGEINAGTFGNTYRGLTLEVQGADHAFLWKPKLPIPDIREHADNQRVATWRSVM